MLIVVGGTIGSGIFRTPSQVAASLPSPSWILGAWTLGGAITLAGALSLAELGAAMPHAGGLYEWLSEAYGELLGFLYGWADFVVVSTGIIAALSIVFAEYVSFFLPLGATGTRAVAIGALAALAATNIVGVRVAAVVGNVLTILKLSALGALVCLGVALGAPHQVWEWRASQVPNTHALGVAMGGVLWSYSGWQHVSFTAGEAKHPTRDVPVGMIVGTAIVTLAYLLTNVAYLRLLPLDRLVASPHVASDAVEASVGSLAGGLVAATVAVSVLGAAAISILTAPRLYWAMGVRGLFFRGVSELHPYWRTPVRAILLQTGWAAILVLAWGTFQKVTSYVLFVIWVFSGLAGAAVIVLRRRLPRAKRPFRVPGFPVVPMLFVAACALFVMATLWARPVEALAGGALLAAGVPVYRFWRKSR